MNIGLNGRYLGKHKTGVGRYLVSLLQEWKRNPRGHTFYIYVSNEELTPEDEALFNLGSPLVLRRVRRPIGTNSFHLWYNWTFPRAMVRDSIDWFFSPDYFSPLLIPKKIRRSQALHDISFVTRPKTFSMLFRIYCFIWSVIPSHSANLIFAVSEYTKNEISRFLRIPDNKIIVAAGAADPIFCPSEKRIIPQVEGLKGPFFLFVGKILNRRHLPELLEAFFRVIKERSDTSTQLVVRGANETVPYQDIQGQIKKINEAFGRPAIICPDYTHDSTLIELYQNTLGFCYLSTYEGFGLPVLEALACGSPVVTVQATSIPEVAGTAALYVNPKDPTDIGAALRQLLSNESLRTSLRENGLLRAQAFSWEISAKVILDSIQKAYDHKS
jgi:glycosyltransferase involved in cell wall biosynthesis